MEEGDGDGIELPLDDSLGIKIGGGSVLVGSGVVVGDGVGVCGGRL